MQNPKVCVLIANHNYSTYLKGSIESALNQTYSPSSICVVDDGSSDFSWDIISSFAEQNQREERTIGSDKGDILLKIGRSGNTDILGVKLPVSGGPSNARNIGIEICLPSFDILAVLDADDEMMPTKLEKCIKPLEDPLIGLSYANYKNFNVDTQIVLDEYKEPFDVSRLNQECIVHSGFVIRKDILLKIKEIWGYFYDTSMRTCEDWSLEISASDFCLFYHIPEVLTFVRVHQNNSTNSVRKEIWERNWSYLKTKHGL